jgi:hypothetical protein
MSRVVESLAPTSAVLALVVWCCWSYLVPSGGRLSEFQDENLPRIEPSRLRPEIRTPSQRDPFCPAAAKPDVAVQEAVMESEPEADSAATPDPRQVVKQLTLKATYLSDRRRIALINERVYEEGDLIPTPGSAGGILKLSQVRSDRVVLEVQGQPVELGYRNVVPSPPEPASDPACPVPVRHDGCLSPPEASTTREVRERFHATFSLSKKTGTVGHVASDTLKDESGTGMDRPDSSQSRFFG